MFCVLSLVCDIVCCVHSRFAKKRERERERERVNFNYLLPFLCEFLSVLLYLCLMVPQVHPLYVFVALPGNI